MSCEYTSTLYCHLMSFPAQKMTSNLRIILTLFDVAALNCVRSSGLLIAVHFITANSNREIQFIARVESLISHIEVFFSNFELKGARFLNGIFPHWGWARSRSLFSFLPLPEPGGATSLLGEMMIINITLVSRPLALLQIPPWPNPHQGFFMSDENIGAHGEKVNRDCSGSHENLEFRFHFDRRSTSFIFLCCHPCFSIFRYQIVNFMYIWAILVYS